MNLLANEADVLETARSRDAAMPDLFAERPPLAERLEAGKRLREQVRRASHAEYAPPPDRRDPVEILEEQAKTRLPDLVPVRYARMLVSPFAYLRGAAAVMATDLAETPATGLTVQACGDAHVSNFGIFPSAERNLVFAINDFDETHPGPWEWDVKRLAASAVLCGRYLRGKPSACADAARACVRAYRDYVRQFAKMGHLTLWNTRIDDRSVLTAVPAALRRHVRQFRAQEEARTHVQVLERMADLVHDTKQILETKPLIVRDTQTAAGVPIREALGRFLQSYAASLPDDRRQLLARYQIRDVARKVVGVGSVGLRCWVMFLEGNAEDDSLILQVKEAQESVLAAHFGKSAYPHEGQRVVMGQRLIQGAPDIFLGWGSDDGGQFYVRHFREMKGSAEFDPAKANPKLPRFRRYCALCGCALALAHAKSGDAAQIAGYVGKSAELDEAIATFAAAYADQTERDHAALADAVRRGRIRAAAES